LNIYNKGTAQGRESTGVDDGVGIDVADHSLVGIEAPWCGGPGNMEAVDDPVGHVHLLVKDESAIINE
jgi:hypothetical protein